MNELCCVTPKRKASLLDLPHEILLAIFLGLPLEDLCTLSCVNHALHTIAGDNQLWSPLCNPLWERFEDNQLIETNICWKTRYITWLRKAIAKYQAGPELEDTRLKVLVIGDSGVGKTSLMRMWIVRRLTMVKCNIRYDFLTKDVVWNSVVYTLQVWDTYGQERFNALSPSFFRHTNGTLVVYDLTRMETVENLRGWIGEMRHHNEGVNVPMVIVGNKTDLLTEKIEDLPTYRAAEEVSKEFGFPHITSSAIENYNVSASFDLLLHTMLRASLQLVAQKMHEPLPRYIPSTDILDKKGIVKDGKKKAETQPSSSYFSYCTLI